MHVRIFGTIVSNVDDESSPFLLDSWQSEMLHRPQEHSLAGISVGCSTRPRLRRPFSRVN